MNKIIPTQYIQELELKTGIKMQFSQLAEIAGTTKQLINQYKEKELPEEYSKKILHYFSKYNKTYTMYSELTYQIPIRGNVEASCGYGVTVYEENVTSTYSISKKFADDLGINPKSSEIIFARGDSMEPTIQGGDCLLVDKSKTEIYDGKIYCTRIDGQVYAKRLQKIPPSTIYIVSDNSKYKGFEVDFSKEIDFDFEVIGEVRWWGRIAK